MCISFSFPLQLAQCRPIPNKNCIIISSAAPMRSPCCNKQEINKEAWSEEEDRKLVDCIRLHGEYVSWRSIPKAAGLLRCGKSCRLRWINYLRPLVKRGNFKEDEEDLIIKLHALLGNRWSLIAGRLPGRTDNEVKNHWNSHLRKRLRIMGVDPDNHRLSTHSASLIRPSQMRLNSPREATVSSNTARLPDLNLEVTISPPPSIAETETKTTKHLQNTGKPITLSLFR